MTNARDKANIPVLNFQSKGIDDNADATAITIDSSERVGINNASPTGALDVKSGTQPQLKVATASGIADRNAGFLVNVSNSATPGSRSAKLLLDADGGDGSGTDNLTITKTGNSGDATITNESNANIVFGTNNAEKMRLTSTGLGIGTSAPVTTLHLSSASPVITFEETDQSNRKFQIGSFGNAYAINDTTNSQFRYILDNSGNHVFNEGGVDCDFRVESDNNTHALFVEGSSGNIGINTSSTQAKLHIVRTDVGALNDGNSNGIMIEDTNCGICIGSATTGEGHIYFSDSNDADVGAMSYFHNSNHLQFRVNASERLRITSAGLVGIATSSPNALLDVRGTAIFNEDGGDKDFRIESSNDSRMFFVDAGNSRIQIGNGASSGKLNVTGDGLSTSGNNPHIIIRNGNQSGGVGTGDKALIMGEVTAGGGVAVPYRPVAFGVENTQSTLREGAFVIYVSDSETVDLSADERLRITNDGSVGIGTVNPSGKLNVIHSAVCANLQMSASSGSTALRLERTNSDGEAIFFVRGSNGVGNISLTSSSTAYNTSSDYRLKENVVDITNATDRLKQLQPKRFNFIADADTTVDGFIAHEVSSVVPEAITGTKDAVDEDGNPEYQGIDQSKLVPLLVKTIQELEARITTLEANNP